MKDGSVTGLTFVAVFVVYVAAMIAASGPNPVIEVRGVEKASIFSDDMGRVRAQTGETYALDDDFRGDLEPGNCYELEPDGDGDYVGSEEVSCDKVEAQE